MKKFVLGLLMLLAAALPAQAQQSLKADTITATTLLLLPYVSGSTQCLHVDSTGHVSGAGFDCGAGGGGAPDVEDNSTTVTAPPVIKFTSGCTVSNSSGDAHVACPGTGGGSAPLEQHIASTSATIDFTTGLTGSCKVYFIEIDGAVPSTQADLQMQVSTDGGSTWVAGSAYDWAVTPNQNIVNGAMTGSGNGTLADAKFVLLGGADGAIHVQGYIYGTQDSSITKSYNLIGTYANGGVSTTAAPYGIWKTTTVVNGLRFKMASGTINTGVFSLFCADTVGGSGGGTAPNVTDGTTTVTAPPVIDFTSGATVTNVGGDAHVAITGGGGGQAIPQPPGRLTLQTGVPVMTTDHVNTVSVFYKADTATLTMPIWNGSAFVMETIPNSGQALLTMDTHQSAGNIYDIFAIDDPGTPGQMQLCTDGSAWTNSTTRAHVIANSVGLWTDAVGMTHCWNKVVGVATDFGPISADRATYLGTVVINGTSGHTDWIMRPSAASGGSANVLGLCNAYNTVPATAIELDSTSSWTFNTSATWRRANAAVGSGLGNSIKYIDCLGTVSGIAHYDQTVNAAMGDQAWLGCAVDWSSGGGLYNGISGVGGSFVPIHAICPIFPNIGLHTIQAIEATSGANNAVYNGAGTQMLTININGM